MKRFMHGSIWGNILERATGIEPVTSSLGSWHSTAELRPLRYRRRRKFIWNYDTLVNQKRCPTLASAHSDKIRGKVIHLGSAVEGEAKSKAQASRNEFNG